MDDNRYTIFDGCSDDDRDVPFHSVAVAENSEPRRHIPLAVVGGESALPRSVSHHLSKSGWLCRQVDDCV